MSKTLVDAIKSGFAQYLTMGTLPVRTTCSMCGKHACTHLSAIEMNPSRVGEFIMSFVEAPRCGGCGAPMQATQDRCGWTCMANGCYYRGQFVSAESVGVFPVREAKKGPEYPSPDDPRWKCHSCDEPMHDVRNGKYLMCRTVGCGEYKKPVPAATRFGSRLPEKPQEPR